MEKKCTKCNVSKELKEYYKSKNSKDGKRSACKLCVNLENFNRYTIVEKRRIRLTSYCKNKNNILEKQRNYYANNKSVKKNYLIKNKEKISLLLQKSHKKWYSKNREIKLLKNKIYNKKRESEDPEYKLRRRLRSRLTVALKNYNVVIIKERNINNLIGCDLKFLKEYLENKFTVEMNWNNHGKIYRPYQTMLPL